jgi:NADPH-dependent ferric siderophore reductase
MTSLVTQARILLADPKTVVDPLCDHLLEHDAKVSRQDGATHITLGPCRAFLRVDEGYLLVRAEAPDLAGLREVKLTIASHVVEFAVGDTAPIIEWTGDGVGVSLPPNFRVLTVAGVEDLTPHMRRITFCGEELARFDGLEALHVRLFLPPPGPAEPAWPMLGENGLLLLPPEDKRPAVRKYTIREIDVAAGRVAIDFVLHDDAGPGSAFATRAQPGDRIGMAGPGGRGLREAEWYVFMADETALPAVGRMLENLPSDARGAVFVEVGGADDEQELVAPAGIEIRWLHRNGAGAGTTTLLQDAFDAIEWPRDDIKIYLWAAMEHSAFKAVRAAARERLRSGRDDHLIVSYWRRGVSEEQHAREKALENAG